MDSLLPLETKIEREYDPLWPNDYEKVVKEMRSAKRAGDQVILASHWSILLILASHWSILF